MNKKLVALAVAGVLAAPLAQAQTANVTLYGRINIDMEVVTAGLTDGTKPNQYRVSSNSSRFGIRGSESLGGGLNAIFQLESSVNADGSGGTIAGRETFAGLQGSWGTVKLGYFLAPYDDIHPIFGNVPTLTTSILSTAAIWANNGYTGANAQNASFDARVGNSIRYDLPNIKGFTGGIQIGARDPGSSGTAAESQRHAYIVSGGLFYNNGPLQAGVAYEQHNKLRAANLDDAALSVAAAWNFGVVRVGGIYERLDYDTPTGDLKRDFFGVSLTANLGPGQIYGFYGYGDDGEGGAATGTRVGGLAKGENTSSQQYEVTYTYPLSKRTLLYTGYVKIANKSNAAYNLAGPEVANMAVGSKPQGFILGGVHFF